MSIFDAFKKSSEQPVRSEQAVIIELRGAGRSEETYDDFDLSTLEERLISAIEGTGLGEYDGNEVGPSGASLYLYGPHADALFERIEGVLKTYPLCRSAQVTVRYGKPGSPQRQLVV